MNLLLERDAKKSVRRVAALAIGLSAAAWNASSAVANDFSSSAEVGVQAKARPKIFQPLAKFRVAGQVAEIAAATPDGKTVLYTDSASKQIGLVDISNPAAPQQFTALNMAGEPTSVAVTPNGRFALACVRDPHLLVAIELPRRKGMAPRIVRTVALGGQPDSIAISNDGAHAVIAIENERPDEDETLPQSPPGFLTIISFASQPQQWQARSISLSGLAERFSNDPEPEYVAIHPYLPVAAVTLQENNHVVLMDLHRGRVLTHWSAGLTTHRADLLDDKKIAFDNMLTARREPDAIAWTRDGFLVTANEGDYDLDLAKGQFTGGRNFTMFTPTGQVFYDDPGLTEMAAAQAGLYPDKRSNKKGSEIEGVTTAVFGRQEYLFVGAERGNFVAIYKLSRFGMPQFAQILATGDRPEGLLALPKRDLFITANEGDGTLSIFKLGDNAS